MEIRQPLQRVPTHPIVLVIAGVILLAVTMTAWYVLARSHPTQALVNAGPTVTCTSSGPDPYSPHDAVCVPKTNAPDPYSPHDPLGAGGK